MLRLVAIICGCISSTSLFIYWLILRFSTILLEFPQISTGERPFIDILQDRRYWVIHLITIPSLFLAGVIFILSGFVYKLFGVANFMRYFYNVPINTQISLINDRFSIFLFIEDV